MKFALSINKPDLARPAMDADFFDGESFARSRTTSPQFHETKDLKVRDEIYRLCRELIKLDEPWKFVVI
jgi:hypothetical protein